MVAAAASAAVAMAVFGLRIIFLRAAASAGTLLDHKENNRQNSNSN